MSSECPFPCMRWFGGLLTLVAVAGCATFPELDASISEAAKVAPAPELVDNRIVLAAAATPVSSENTQETLEARSGALLTRAEGLAGPVIDPAEAERITGSAARLRQEATRVAPEN